MSKKEYPNLIKWNISVNTNKENDIKFMAIIADQVRELPNRKKRTRSQVLKDIVAEWKLMKKEEL